MAPYASGDLTIDHRALGLGLPVLLGIDAEEMRSQIETHVYPSSVSVEIRTPAILSTQVLKTYSFSL